jgi:hypothetical protein
MSEGSERFGESEATGPVGARTRLPSAPDEIVLASQCLPARGIWRSSGAANRCSAHRTQARAIVTKIQKRMVVEYGIELDGVWLPLAC